MNRRLFAYLMPVLLLVASILQSTAANRIEIRNVKPDLVLLLIVAAALIYGSQAAVGWAFLGGVALDLFSGGPLGSSSLALMAAALVVGVGRQTLSRFNVLVPLTATALATLVYGATYIALLAGLEGLTSWLSMQGFTFDLVQPDLPAPLWSTLFWPTMQVIVLPALFYNTALSVALIPLLNRVPELEY
jgi:rod shape-determining protein MreD